MYREGSKLVRDFIPALDKAKEADANYKYQTVEDPQVLTQLIVEKLGEEIAEVLRAESKEHRTEEIGDVLTILRKLAENFGIDWQKVLEAEQLKSETKGSFKANIVSIPIK